MELLEVFDIHGNRLGKSIERGSKKIIPSGEFFAVSVIFLENSEGNFLIQKTSERKGRRLFFNRRTCRFRRNTFTNN